MGDPTGKDCGPGMPRPLHMGPLLLGASRGAGPCQGPRKSQQLLMTPTAQSRPPPKDEGECLFLLEEERISSDN